MDEHPHHNRDARDGRFVSDETAAADPDHTVVEDAQPVKGSAVADNLARFLTEQLGVPFTTAHGDDEIVLALSIEDARAMYEARVALFERLSPSVAGQLWRRIP